MSAIDKFIEGRIYSGGALAIAEVAKAIARKEMPPAKHLDCVDCGRRASVYDHRDYNAPLEVSPVCRPCNYKRGPAIPKKWKRGEFNALVTLMIGRAYQGRSYLHDRLAKFAGLA